MVVVVGAVQSSRAESKEVGERGSWEDEHGRGVVEPERPVEYLGRCSIVVMGGRQRSTDGLGSFFRGAVSKIGWVGSKKGTRE